MCVYVCVCESEREIEKDEEKRGKEWVKKGERERYSY